MQDADSRKDAIHELVITFRQIKGTAMKRSDPDGYQLAPRIEATTILAALVIIGIVIALAYF